MVGIFPVVAMTAPSSAEPRKTWAPSPIRSSKLRVEVEKTYDLSGHPGLVAHAERTAGDLDAGADGAVDGEERLVLELCLVHAGRRADPGADLRVELAAAPDLGRGAEMADVGHAGTEEDVLDLGARPPRKGA